MAVMPTKFMHSAMVLVMVAFWAVTMMFVVLVVSVVKTVVATNVTSMLMNRTIGGK